MFFASEGVAEKLSCGSHDALASLKSILGKYF